MLTRLLAIVPLEFCRPCISPAIRCEKNSIGIRSIFHINVLLPTTASLPFIRREYTACTQATMSWITPIPASPMMNGMNQSGFCPVSSRSRNIRENAGFIIPISEVIKLVSTTNATAVPAPLRRFPANSSILFGFPEGSKVSFGSNIITMPVNALSNSSIVTATFPRAGSLRYALLPLNPLSTTK